MVVVVLGAGGIIGQEMIHCAPDSGDIYIFTSRSGGGPFTAFDADSDRITGFLDRHMPDVVVNLMGENRVDVVEANPAPYRHINVMVPRLVAMWCNQTKARLIHVSTQGVFSGEGGTTASTSSLSTRTSLSETLTVHGTSTVSVE